MGMQTQNLKYFLVRTREQIEELPEYVQNTNITVQHIEQGHVFDLEINV